MERLHSCGLNFKAILFKFSKSEGLLWEGGLNWNFSYDRQLIYDAYCLNEQFKAGEEQTYKIPFTDTALPVIKCVELINDQLEQPLSYAVCSQLLVVCVRVFFVKFLNR